MSLRVALTGASGLIGTALSIALRDAGHEVLALRRGADWDPARGILAPERFEGLDALVHLAGANIGDGRWTEDRKRLIVDSRVRSSAAGQ